MAYASPYRGTIGPVDELEATPEPAPGNGSESGPALETAAIARAVAGDRDELGRLLGAVEPELRRGLSIRPLWRRSLDADDVLQVSHLEAFLRIHGLRDTTPAGFRAWMQRLVQNNLRDAIRALERDKRPDARRRSTRGPAGESARTLLIGLAAEGGTVSEPAMLEDELARLQRALAKLPRSYRLVVQRMDLEERDVDLVAAELKRSRGAVHLLRSRAHDRLRELLGGSG